MTIFFLRYHCRCLRSHLRGVISFAGYRGKYIKTAIKCLKTSTRVPGSVIGKGDVPSRKNTINVNIRYMLLTKKEINKKQIGDKVQGGNWINKTYY